ncbi:MAG: hypothetical protein JWL57_2071 [Actinobacteria bacterium]|nr:hypothetical protein [Actinomycetota bacterium]
MSNTPRYLWKILPGLLAVLLVACSSSPPAATSTPVPVGDLASLGPLASPSPGTIGAEGAPIPQAPPLADLSKAATGQDVDGIKCETAERVTYHIHAHLAVYVDGKPRQVPFGIGIPDPVTQNANGFPFVVSGKCFYWLHTHMSDGIIHVESPSARGYTLGEFFDIWGQPLSTTQAGPVTGTVTAFYRGRPYTGSDLRAIPLTAHADIQLDIGTPLVAPEVTDFGKL